MAEENESDQGVSKEAFDRRLKEIEDLKAELNARDEVIGQAQGALQEVNQRMKVEEFFRSKGVSDPTALAKVALPHVVNEQDADQFSATLEGIYDTLGQPSSTAPPAQELAPVPGVAAPNPAAPGITPAQELVGSRDWLIANKGRNPSFAEYKAGREAGTITPEADISNSVITTQK